MKRFAFFLSFLFMTLAVQSQVIIVGASDGKKEVTDSTGKKIPTIRLHGRVYDSFTKAALKAHVTLMRSDSTVVDTMTCYHWSWGTSDSYYEFRVPRKVEKFIVKGSCEGYEDNYVDFDMKYIARNTEFQLPRLLLKKKADDDIIGETSLDGVVITGTKVKIAYRGDTIVYNASAFNLPEGSMLDGLIRQMPGAELKANGDIYVNGKKIDYLTLNGKDFFKGNNQVMLDNLPYYTVQSVEVFNKSNEESQWKGEEIGQKDYVMDVKLKREYNRGVLVNAEAGIGTDNRYMARLFGLYYTDHSRLSMFGNTNNVNEERKPGYEGDWEPSNMPQGLRSTKQVGFNLTTEDQDKNYEERMDGTVQWSDADNETRTLSERFATEGNILSGSNSFSKQKDFRLNVSNMFRLKNPIRLYSNMRASYSDGKRQSESNDSTYRDYIINQSRNASMNKYRTVSLGGAVGWFNKLPWGDNVDVYVTGSYNSNKPSESFRQNETYYAQTGGKDFRNYYNDTHSHGYAYNTEASYTIHFLNSWNVEMGGEYSQNYISAHNYNYRLDWLGETALPSTDGQASSIFPLGWLPSNELLMSVLDDGNSDSHTNLKRQYRGIVNIYTQGKDDDHYFAFTFPLTHYTERMHFMDDKLDTIARRHDTYLLPSVSYYDWGKSGFKQFYYSADVSRPDFASIMPADDTTNPLSMHINNPNLKKTITHNLSTNLNFRTDSLKRTISTWGNLSVTRNAVGTRSMYNPTTGAYTFMQDNINGNWNASLGGRFEQPIDRKKRLQLSESLLGNYTHNVDFALATATETATEEALQGQLVSLTSNYSKVNTFYLENNLRLTYQYGDLTVGLNGNIGWRNSTSDREDFEKINTVDYDYGMTFKYKIPVVKLDVATDIKMFSKRGYDSEMMNTDDLVWNASLSYPFLKGKLIAKLMAFDILHQLSSTQYSVNAQGRTETWHNCIPRYAMLTLAYKFQKMPKKK